MSLRSLFIPLLLLFVLLAAPARAEDGEVSEQASSSEQTGVDATEAPTPGVAVKAAGLPPVDALGRPFPDPGLLRLARRWTISGAVLTVAGSSLFLAGMLLSSAAARGQLVVPTEAFYGFGALLGGGPSLVLVGLPLLSSGTFTRGQLLRTIKGVAKVPRTVANERSYWEAYQLGLYGQAVAIGGGASLLMGVLGLVAAGLAVNSEYYDARLWAVPAIALPVGGAMIVAGLLMGKASKAKMERIQNAVDPFRQKPETSRSSTSSVPPRALALVPMPSLTPAPDGRGGVVPRASLNWSLRF